MAFDIYARGVPGFRYRNGNCSDGDVFTIGNALLNSRPQRFSSSNVRMNGLRSIARSQAAHLLATGIDLILANPRKRFGFISFHMVTNSLIWNSSLNCEMKLINIDSSHEFHRKLLRALRKMKMDNFGVILEVAKALNMYSAVLPNREPPMLMIYLTN